MNTPSAARRTKSRAFGVLVAALAGIGLAGCFTTPDPLRLKCTSQAGCPKDYFCAADKCQRGTGLGGTGGVAGRTGSSDGGGTSTDGPRGTGGMGDGASPFGGSGGSSLVPDGQLSGGGGAGGLADGPGLGGFASGGISGGSGGFISPDAPSSNRWHDRYSGCACSERRPRRPVDSAKRFNLHGCQPVQQ
jgi:hypothetical protein